MFEARIDCANYLLFTAQEESYEDCIHDIENYDFNELNEDLRTICKDYIVYWAIYDKDGKEFGSGTMDSLIGDIDWD